MFDKRFASWRLRRRRVFARRIVLARKDGHPSQPDERKHPESDDQGQEQCCSSAFPESPLQVILAAIVSSVVDEVVVVFAAHAVAGKLSYWQTMLFEKTKRPAASGRGRSSSSSSSYHSTVRKQAGRGRLLSRSETVRWKISPQYVGHSVADCTAVSRPRRVFKLRAPKLTRACCILVHTAWVLRASVSASIQ